MRLRDFRTRDGEQILAEIAKQKQLGRNTLLHIKNLLSATFKHAKRLGVINGVNPIQDVSIPKAKPSAETYAYSLEEIFSMLSVLSYPASTIVATAAFTGLRRSELRGILWENYRDGALWVTQSVWERFVSEPKTERSKGAVPVIAPLAKLLETHRHVQGNPQTGFMFVSRNYAGTKRAVDLESLLKWQIKPRLEENKLVWHGWHAFRRGLATNLHRLGVPDKTDSSDSPTLKSFNYHEHIRQVRRNRRVQRYAFSRSNMHPICTPLTIGRNQCRATLTHSG